MALEDEGEVSPHPLGGVERVHVPDDLGFTNWVNGCVPKVGLTV